MDKVLEFVDKLVVALMDVVDDDDIEKVGDAMKNAALKHAGTEDESYWKACSDCYDQAVYDNQN